MRVPALVIRCLKDFGIFHQGCAAEGSCMLPPRGYHEVAAATAWARAKGGCVEKLEVRVLAVLWSVDMNLLAIKGNILIWSNWRVIDFTKLDYTE